MSKLQAFIVESISEMRTKVSWPSYGELQNSSVLVLVASLIFALMIGLFDYVFKFAMTEFYKAF